MTSADPAIPAEPSNEAAAPARGSLRRRVGRLLTLVGVTLATLILLGAVGQILRDRWLVTALLMYLPLLPLGALGVVLDVARRGKGLPRVPFGLSTVALPAALWSAWAMTGHATDPASPAAGETLTVVQWNVQWGGGGHRRPRMWAGQCQTLAAQSPDVVVLSEAPHAPWLAKLPERMGDGWSMVWAEHPPGSTYWYRLAVASRWAVREVGRFDLTNGTALAAEIDAPGGPLRVLAVDGVSTPTVSRLPFLRDVEKVCHSAALLGQPFHVVAGDFNAPSRSIGFDAFRLDRGGDYALAAEHARGWRATFPAPVAVYDIDHVWIRGPWRMRGATFFGHATTNHRGQRVALVRRGW